MSDKFILVVSTENYKFLKSHGIDSNEHMDVVVTDEVWTGTSVEMADLMIEYVGEKLQQGNRQQKPWYRKERW